MNTISISRYPLAMVPSQVLRVSILGAPNSGKSSLGNGLVGAPVFAAASKIHTTRVLAKGIAVHGPTQVPPDDHEAEDDDEDDDGPDDPLGHAGRRGGRAVEKARAGQTDCRGP